MRKRVLASFFAVILAAALSACGSSGKSYDSAAAGAPAMAEEAAEEIAMDSYYSEEYKEAEMTAEGAATEAPEVEENATVSERKLIKTVDLSVETKDYDSLMASLEKQIEELGGYIESLGAYNGSYYDGRDNRSANITARIPADKLDGFVKQIGKEANVVDRNESVEDVTLQYVDLDSHARMLEEEQERLLELLENAETIEDIIAIEGRLSEVKYQLESMKSQLRTYDNQVQYSTVHIYIDEVRELTPVVELTAGERIAEGFMDSIEDIGEGIKEFFIEFIIHIPYIVVCAVVIVILVFIALKLMKAIDKRSARLMEEAGKVTANMKNRKTTGSMTKGNIQSPDGKRSPYVQRPGKQNVKAETDVEEKSNTEINKTE